MKDCDKYACNCLFHSISLAKGIPILDTLSHQDNLVVVILLA